MMLDKKGRLFGKVSIIDILVVLILIAAVLGGAMAYQKITNKDVLTENKGLIQNSAIDTLEVKMRLNEVRDVTYNAISIGDDVYSAETNKLLGVIVDVAQEPASKLIYDLKGKAVEATIPDRIDVVLTVHIPGSRLENGYFTADNIQLVYDSSMEIKTPSIQTTPVIETITLIPGA
ncbi:MAG: DUF4330 domain-containing protein [Ruminococcaceae bacterium]|nr:DUF4330 domain-containing protein [Oscillospiraceae bacterium]